MAKKSGTSTGKLSDFFYPPRSTICTKTFSQFLADYHENLDSFFFVVRLVAQADEGRVRAARALIEGAKPEELERLQKSANDPDAALRQLKRFSTVQSRNLTNATVNGFQRYFSTIIQAAALRRPEILRSSETVQVDEVLRSKRHKDVVSLLIDKKINELSYGGIRAMESYFRVQTRCRDVRDRGGASTSHNLCRTPQHQRSQWRCSK